MPGIPGLSSHPPQPACLPAAGTFGLFPCLSSLLPLSQDGAFPLPPTPLPQQGRPRMPPPRRSLLFAFAALRTNPSFLRCFPVPPPLLFCLTQLRSA